MKAEIKVTAEAEGFDETIEKVEALRESLERLPSQVTIQNCSGCTINVYASQSVFNEMGEEEDE